MKKNKFLKALLAIGIAIISAVSVFGMAACGDGDGDGGEQATVTEVTVESLHGERSLYEGKTLQFVATVSGTNNPSQSVTWKSSDPTKATVSDSGLVTGVDAGSVTITATSKIDDSQSGSYDLTIKEIPSIPANESDRAIVPTYSGEAAGPQAGTHEVAYSLLGADFTDATLADDYDDGIFSLPSGTAFRNQEPNGGSNPKGYKRSIQNGKITVNVPADGTLSFYFASGSSTVGNAKYKITKNGTNPTETTINLAIKVLTSIELEVKAGDTIVFEKSGGTVDTYEVVLSLGEMEATPIKSIILSSAGTTDYLVTQKVDCTGVKLIAVDESNVTYDISLVNCRFDTSKYNPYLSGEYEIGVTYCLDSNLGSETKEFKATYKVKVYEVDSIELDLIGLSGNNQVTAQQAYLISDTYKVESTISVIATCDLDGNKVDFKLKNDWYSLTNSVDLSVAGKHTVTVSVDDNYTIGNKIVSASYEIVSAAKKDVVNNVVTVTVGKNCEFSNVTQAVQYLKKCDYKATVNKVIEIEAGTYAEKVWIDVPNVTLIGKGAKADDTTITWSLVEGDPNSLTGALWGLNCATVHVTGANFKAYNLAIRNDFDYINNAKKYEGMSQGSQGVALTLDADGAVLYNCHLYGNQDTLYMKSGRSYYYKTQIDGNVDFIFGGDTGLAFFEECKIVAVNRTKVAEGQKGSAQNGYVTAAKHDAAKKPDYGYVFYKCNMTDDGKVADGAMSLGRSWGTCATVAFIECDFSKAYSKLPSTDGGKDHRWSNWSGGTAATDADFCEFESKGDGAIDTAVTGGKILADSTNYTKDNLFSKSNGSGKLYSTDFDWDAAFTTLKILAGLESGEIPQETTITVDLKLDSLPNGNCVAKINETYGEVLTWEGSGSFEVAKPTNGVKIGTDTVIKINVVGEVSLIAGYELPASDYVITYKDGKATITFVAATGTYGTYLGGIVIDTSKTPSDT